MPTEEHTLPPDLCPHEGPCIMKAEVETLKQIAEEREVKAKARDTRIFKMLEGIDTVLRGDMQNDKPGMYHQVKDNTKDIHELKEAAAAPQAKPLLDIPWGKIILALVGTISILAVVLSKLIETKP